MALLHRAELNPGKLDLLAAWLPTRPWYRGPAVPNLKRVASFRYDDPAGEVGMETLLVDPGDGSLMQTPLTYRNAPLDGRDDLLVGTTDHSVLGKRWVYDACGDPVFVTALATTILTGAGQAEELLEVDGRLEPRPSTTSAVGSGIAGGEVPTVGAVVRVDDDDPALIVTGTVELTVPRVPGAADNRPGGTATLSGTWSGQSVPLILAYARVL